MDDSTEFDHQMNQWLSLRRRWPQNWPHPPGCGGEPAGGPRRDSHRAAIGCTTHAGVHLALDLPSPTTEFVNFSPKPPLRISSDPKVLRFATSIDVVVGGEGAANCSPDRA